jgi:hypothetical protein
MQLFVSGAEDLDSTSQKRRNECSFLCPTRSSREGETRRRRNETTKSDDTFAKRRDGQRVDRTECIAQRMKPRKGEEGSC